MNFKTVSPDIDYLSKYFDNDFLFRKNYTSYKSGDTITIDRSAYFLNGIRKVNIDSFLYWRVEELCKEYGLESQIDNICYFVWCFNKFTGSDKKHFQYLESIRQLADFMSVNKMQDANIAEPVTSLILTSNKLTDSLKVTDPKLLHELYYAMVAKINEHLKKYNVDIDQHTIETKIIQDLYKYVFAILNDSTSGKKMHYKKMLTSIIQQTNKFISRDNKELKNLLKDRLKPRKNIRR
jgi:hypothetical protein